MVSMPRSISRHSLRMALGSLPPAPELPFMAVISTSLPPTESY